MPSVRWNFRTKLVFKYEYLVNSDYAYHVFVIITDLLIIDCMSRDLLETLIRNIQGMVPGCDFVLALGCWHVVVLA